MNGLLPGSSAIDAIPELPIFERIHTLIPIKIGHTMPLTGVPSAYAGNPSFVLPLQRKPIPHTDVHVYLKEAM
jgi:hypothetical protein